MADPSRYNRCSDDRGEVASWLILAAGLTLAAGLAAGTLQSTIGKLAEAVGKPGQVALIAGAPGSGDPRPTGVGDAGVEGPGTGSPSGSNQSAFEAVQLLTDDPADQTAIWELVLAGAPIDLAYAQVTGDWSGVDGGDPGSYSLELQRAILEAAGVQVGPDTDVNGLLFDSLPDWAIAALFNEGTEIGVAVTIGSDPDAPFGVRASVKGEIKTQLSGTQIGVGFSQTQAVQIETEIIASAEVFADGKRIGFAAGEFTGTNLTYQATLNEDQAAALAGGDTSVLPNIYDPDSFEVGNSALILVGDIEGTTGEVTYGFASISGETKEFDGEALGVTRIDDNTIAIFAGPVDAVENTIGVGVGVLSIQAKKTAELSSLDYAELDLSTPAGQAAYLVFLSTGEVPSTDSNGVTTATTSTLTVGSNVGIVADVGVFSAKFTVNDQSSDRTVTTYGDGSQTATSTFNFSDAQIETTAPLQNGVPIQEESVTTVVLAGVEGNAANAIATITGSPHPTSLADQNVQLHFTNQDLLNLQVAAQQSVDNIGSAAGPLAMFLAEAPSTDAIVGELARRASITSASQFANDLQFLAVNSSEDGLGIGAFTGSAEYQPTS